MAQGAPLFIGERIQVERAKDQVTIRISQKIKGWQEAMLYAWLMAWTFCGAVFIYSLVTTTVSSEIFFFSICTAVWLYFFYRILRVLMWRKRGEEVLTFTPGKLELRNAFGSKGSSLEVELDKMSQLGMVNQDPNSFFYFLDDSFWVMGGDRLGFAYKGKKYRFGKQLTPRDAQQLLKSVDSAVKGFSGK